MACSGQLRTVSHRTLSREGYYGMFWSAEYSLTQNVVQKIILWYILVSCVQSHTERCPEKDIMACSVQLSTVSHRTLSREGYYGTSWSAAYSLTQNAVQRSVLSTINSLFFCLLQNILIHKINIQVTQLIFTLSWQLNSTKSSLELTAASVLVNSSVPFLNLLLPSS